tara:strand:+ start:430 stop:1020 length:591 start_codon:yes stop_codon:yes gene_type:complete
MASYVFDSILTKGMQAGQVPARTREAREWYRNTAQNRDVTPTKLMRENKSKATRGAEPGSMMLFNYDPKFKKDLPYYDTFPLIFVVGPAEGGFYGLNMHYLPYRQRAMLMDALYDLASNSRYDDSTKLKLSYSLLSKASNYKYFKPCFKHYLNRHVKSRKFLIDSVEWDIALFLPLQRFQKASSSQVYSDSIKKAS